jgi:hypothetical protein
MVLKVKWKTHQKSVYSTVASLSLFILCHKSLSIESPCVQLCVIEVHHVCQLRDNWYVTCVCVPLFILRPPLVCTRFAPQFFWSAFHVQPLFAQLSQIHANIAHTIIKLFSSAAHSVYCVEPFVLSVGKAAQQTKQASGKAHAACGIFTFFWRARSLIIFGARR